MAQKNIQMMNVRKQQLLYAPTISLYANYTLQFLKSDLNLFTNNWYPYNYVGLKLNLPIFDGLKKYRTIEEYKMRAELSRLTLDKLRQDYKQEADLAATSIRNASSEFNYQKKNLALVDNLYQIDNERLKNGVIKASDLNSTYYTLQQTQLNYISAVYNYLLAIVKYRQATGSL